MNLRQAIEYVLDYIREWDYEDRGYDYNVCPSCNWNTRKDRTDEVRLGHHPDCKLREAIDILEKEIGDKK